MYLWIKAFHIIAVICWFAGLFYLPRLYVYHAMSEDQVSKDRFKIMERKLFRGIMTPSAILAIGLGIFLITLNPGLLQTNWMRAKLFCVVILVCYHIMCWVYLKKFEIDTSTHNHVYFRWFNEFPVALLLAIVILVVVKPF
jgi:protoporphyrinogen IX oxidase